MAAVTAGIIQSRAAGDDSAGAVLASYCPGLGVAAIGLVIALARATRRRSE